MHHFLWRQSISSKNVFSLVCHSFNIDILTWILDCKAYYSNYRRLVCECVVVVCNAFCVICSYHQQVIMLTSPLFNFSCMYGFLFLNMVQLEWEYAFGHLLRHFCVIMTFVSFILQLIKQWLPCTLMYESCLQFEDHSVFVYTVKGHSNKDLYIWFTT